MLLVGLGSQLDGFRVSRWWYRQIVDCLVLFKHGFDSPFVAFFPQLFSFYSYNHSICFLSFFLSLFMPLCSGSDSSLMFVGFSSVRVSNICHHSVKIVLGHLV